MTPKTIMIDLFDEAEELDVIGPWEVLAHWTQTHPEDGWQVALVSDDGTQRQAAKGLTLTPTSARSAVTAPDSIVEPGGRGSRVRMNDEEYVTWLQTQHANGTLMVSICTGALIFGKAGFLEGRPCVTHGLALEELHAVSPTALIQLGKRWADDGDLITAGGVSAGIDVALQLVFRLAGASRAREVRQEIEYFPSSPEWS